MPATPDQCRRYRERLRQRAIDAVGNCCRFCGSTAKLEFAHRLPTGLSGPGRGNFHRYRDIIRNPHKYFRACHECHTAYDRGITAQCRRLPKIPPGDIGDTPPVSSVLPDESGDFPFGGNATGTASDMEAA